jgi:hypothetical protein
MKEEDRAEYWNMLADAIWAAMQRPSPPITRDEIAQLCESKLRAFYYQLYTDYEAGNQRHGIDTKDLKFLGEEREPESIGREPTKSEISKLLPDDAEGFYGDDWKS